MDKKVFTVPNIGCDGCTRTIEAELGDISGVKSVSAEVDSKQVQVEWDTPASWEQIKATLVEIEYPPAE